MRTLDRYRGTVIARRYCLPPSLARVVLAQPHLYVGIVGENSKDPAFVRLDRIDLRNPVDRKSLDIPSTLVAKFNRILNTNQGTCTQGF